MDSFWIRRSTLSRGDTSQTTVSRKGPMENVTTQHRAIVMWGPPFCNNQVDRDQVRSGGKL
jgi:hypothetical protein